MVDIGSLMQKLEKSEKAREEIENKLMVQDAKMGKYLSCLFVFCHTCHKLHSASDLQLDYGLPQFDLSHTEAQFHPNAHSRLRDCSDRWTGTLLNYVTC